MKKYSDSKYEFSDSTVNFGRHKVLECAREIFEKSQDTSLDKNTFIRISDDLELMLAEVRETCEDLWVGGVVTLARQISGNILLFSCTLY